MSDEVKQEEIIEEEIATENVEVVEEVEEVESDEVKFASLDEEFKLKMENLVEEANKKALESEDKYLRTHADFENVKKRLEREKYQAIEYGSEKFAKDLLAPIDALDMALASANGDAPKEELLEKLKEGIELTIKSFATTFEKNNIEIVETVEFDPEYHNAVMKVDSQEHEAGQIVQVMQKGYKLKERLLRPAMVSIAN